MNILPSAIGKRSLIREIDDNCNLIVEISGIIVEDEIFRPFAGKCAFSSLGHLLKELSFNQHCYTFIQPMYKGEYNEEQKNFLKVLILVLQFIEIIQFCNVV